VRSPLLGSDSFFNILFSVLKEKSRLVRSPLLGSVSVNTFPRQRIHAIIKLLDASLSVRFVSYQRKVGY
jgi:hypothetical protein